MLLCLDPQEVCQSQRKRHLLPVTCYSTDNCWQQHTKKASVNNERCKNNNVLQ